MERSSEEMRTVSEILNRLKERGIENGLKMDENHVFHVENTDIFYVNPKDLLITKVYRFEGDSNPDDNAIIYLMKDAQGRETFLLDAYGAKNNISEEFMNFIKDIPVAEIDH